MLKDFSHYQNLGTPLFYRRLFAIFDNGRKTWKKQDLIQFFSNKSIDGRTNFEGCLKLALEIKVIIEQESEIIINPKITSLDWKNEELDYIFCKYLFKSLKEDKEFINIFSSKYFTFDIIQKIYLIDNSAFKFRYSNLKQLLFDFHVLEKHPAGLKFRFVLNSNYKKLLDKNVFPLLKKKEVYIEDFEKSLLLKKMYGEEAEKFVLKFESKRLRQLKNIEWVAQYVVNAGYDIASYDNTSDLDFNRFIEVKSYEGPKPYFYWSRNEFMIAKQKKEKYWLYLIDRKLITKKNYQPLKIQNPFKSVLKNEEWVKDIENYKISMLK